MAKTLFVGRGNQYTDNLSSLPGTGSYTGQVVCLPNNNCYRWTGGSWELTPVRANDNVATIYDNNNTRTVNDPVNNLSDLFLHSALPFLKANTAITGTLTLPSRVPGQNCGKKKGRCVSVPSHGNTTYTLATGSYGTNPHVIMVDSTNNKTLAGTAIIQTVGAESMRSLTVYSNANGIYVDEIYFAYNGTLPEITINYKLFVITLPTEQTDTRWFYADATNFNVNYGQLNANLGYIKVNGQAASGTPVSQVQWSNYYYEYEGILKRYWREEKESKSATILWDAYVKFDGEFEGTTFSAPSPDGVNFPTSFLHNATGYTYQRGSYVTSRYDYNFYWNIWKELPTWTYSVYKVDYTYNYHRYQVNARGQWVYGGYFTGKNYPQYSGDWNPWNGYNNNPFAGYMSIRFDTDTRTNVQGAVFITAANGYPAYQLRYTNLGSDVKYDPITDISPYFNNGYESSGYRTFKKNLGNLAYELPDYRAGKLLSTGTEWREVANKWVSIPPGPGAEELWLNGNIPIGNTLYNPPGRTGYVEFYNRDGDRLAVKITQTQQSATKQDLYQIRRGLTLELNQGKLGAAVSNGDTLRVDNTEDYTSAGFSYNYDGFKAAYGKAKDFPNNVLYALNLK